MTARVFFWSSPSAADRPEVPLALAALGQVAVAQCEPGRQKLYK